MRIEEESSKWLSVAEAAEKYFVCDRTIRNWIKTGKLAAVLIEDNKAKSKGQFSKKWLIVQ